jgi:hypothetical protein
MGEWVGFNTRSADFSVYLDHVPADVPQSAVEGVARDMRCTTEFVGLWNHNEAAGTRCWKVTFYAKRDAARFARHLTGTTPWGGKAMRARVGTERDRALVRSVMTFRQCVAALNAIATPFGWSNSVPFTLLRPRPLPARAAAPPAPGADGTAGGALRQEAGRPPVGGVPAHAGAGDSPSLVSAASLGLFVVANAVLAGLPPDVFDREPCAPPAMAMTAYGSGGGGAAEWAGVGADESAMDETAGSLTAEGGGGGGGGDLDAGSLWVINGVGARTEEDWILQSTGLPQGLPLPLSCSRSQRPIPAPYLGMPGSGSFKPPDKDDPGPCVHIGMALHLHGCRLNEWATLPTETIVAHGGCTCELRGVALAQLSKFSSPDAVNLNAALRGGGGGDLDAGAGLGGGAAVASPVVCAWGSFGAMPQAAPPPAWNTLPPTCPVAHCAAAPRTQSDIRPWTMRTALVNGCASADRIGVHVASAVQFAFQAACEKVQLRMAVPTSGGGGGGGGGCEGGSASPVGVGDVSPAALWPSR